MLTFEFTDVVGRMTESDVLTSGMTGRQIQILTDSSWENLTKTYVFRAGHICRSISGASPITMIPEAVLAQPFQRLYVGVYCTDDAGSLVIPTIMAEGPMIRYGADPTEDSPEENPDLAKQLQEQIGDLQKLKTDDKSSLVAAINEVHDEKSGTTALNANAVKLLIQILRAGVYTTDQTNAINELQFYLTPSDLETDAPTTAPSDPENPDPPEDPDDPGQTEPELTGITVSYTGGDVPAGTPVTDLTGLTVTAHYSDGSTETVTGYTVTGTIAVGSNMLDVSYKGKFAIFTVTGTAASSETPEEAELIHYWDFTQSLTDSVGGVTITTANTTRDENGLHFNAANSIAKTGIDITGKTVEVEFGAAEKQGTNHGRCITIYNTPDADAPSYGILWHNTGKWASYNMADTGWVDGENTDPNAIANGVLRIPFKTDGATFDVLLNGEVFLSNLKHQAAWKYLFIGSNSTVFYHMTVKNLKIYEGA